MLKKAQTLIFVIYSYFSPANRSPPQPKAAVGWVF
jgi:hypothetical protein